MFLQGINERTFVLFAYIFNYFTPMLLISVFYYSIVKAVVAHEAALRAQAKKMNVDSLRSGAQSEESAEIKIAKVDTISRYLNNNLQKMVIITLLIIPTPGGHHERAAVVLHLDAVRHGGGHARARLPAAPHAPRLPDP